MKNFKAFTLAEILLTVGIIGVVAALTMPTLSQNYFRQTKAVQLRKATTDITNAIDDLILNEDKSLLSQTSICSADGVQNFIKKYLKIVKTCSANTSGCMSNRYSSIDGTKSERYGCTVDSYVLANSVAICATYSSDKIDIYIDTNGPAKPNIGGRDMFHVYILKDGQIFDSAVGSSVTCNMTSNSGVCIPPSSYKYSDAIATCKSNVYGAGCYSALTLNSWKMEY